MASVGWGLAVGKGIDLYKVVLRDFIIDNAFRQTQEHNYPVSIQYSLDKISLWDT